MIKLLTDKYQKHVAWLLFFVFYGELAGSLYAGAKMPVKTFNDRRDFGICSFSEQPAITILSDDPGKKVKTTNPKTVAEAKQSDDNIYTITGKEKPEGEGNIGGPGQPEMSTYKSVGTDNMVNLFTGDFSYNIPLLDVGGYPVNLFYNAGATMDQEASWVGLGWNINPGTINRNMRGLPDDYNGEDSIIKEQAIKKDLTVGVNGSLGGELVGVPGLSLNVNGGIFYNNRRGVGIEAGAGFDYSPAKGIAATNKDDKTQKDTIQTLSISGSVSLNSQNGMSLNGGFSIYKANKEKYSRFGLSTGLSYNSRQGLTDLRIDAELTKYRWQCNGVREVLIPTTGSGSTQVSSISFARSSYTPSIRMPLTKFNAFLNVKMGFEGKVFFGNGSVGGYVNETRLDAKDQIQKKPAYGYWFYERAKDDRNAMLDFNRVNDGVYTMKKPIIDFPAYTYDVFNISGEGTGGSFRGYRANMGNMRDNDTRNKTSSFSLSLDIGSGDLIHGGAIIGGVYSPAYVTEWKMGNTLRNATAFTPSEGAYQSVYMKNPGEKAIIDEEYYTKMGGDQLVRPYLKNIHSAVPMLASGFQVFDKNRNLDVVRNLSAGDSKKIPRDKRTQVITWLNAIDATHVGLDKTIYSYKENVLSPGSCPSSSGDRSIVPRYDPLTPSYYRKRWHMSEVDVLESDGRRYVFGIPVYQVEQKEVTFSTNNLPASDDQLVGYTPGNENSTSNKDGRDGMFERESMRGYAHSFLLSGILSPDYVDITGDGITDDDLGTAIRFNYSRVDKKRHPFLNASYWDNYKWRVPADPSKANFNEGLKADNRDNKGHYTYGVKELWYLHSIESKNMIAAFYVAERHDGKPVYGEDGGVNTNGDGQKLLKLINLYTKADYLRFLKTGKTPRPVKTVHFEYDYSTCPGFALNDEKAVDKNGTLLQNFSDPLNVNKDKGKLTLKAIWFSYNGNNNQVKNKYVFKYAVKTVSGNNINIDNPGYSPVESDRWGNYKPHSANPEDVPGHKALNQDYPYTIQGAGSNDYAAAWNLEKILLPGGGMVTVQYEADDYAYVQNKRACQMMKIAGFGEFNTSTPDNKLYRFDPTPEKLLHPGQMDYPFVFFDVDDAITGDVQEIAGKYLQDMSQLLMKLWVKMPAGNVGENSAYEPVIVYAGIKEFGVVAGNNHRFWVRMQATGNGGSPVMQTIMQFLKDLLPQRAYPGYEVNGDGAGPVKQVVRAIFGMMHNLVGGVLGFEKTLKGSGHCKEVKLSMSFARLNSPNLKKIGGGHRVKKVIIVDNWAKMTQKPDANGMPDSYYGQIYDYTTTEIINGEKKVISSGVASYEPGVGNEENPFREVLKYSETQFLGPTDHSNVELPVAENFFPSPMVGYSRVTVRSIHNNSNGENKKFKSGIGLQQTEFYTTRDFPVFSDYTSFDDESRHHHKPGILQRIFNFNKKDYMTLTQGFRVVLNDMNGKLKSQTSYAENDYQTPVNYTANYYRLTPTGNNKYKLDNVLPVIGGSDGKIYNKLVGKDIEIMNDFREHFSYTYAINIPVNAEFFTAGPIPIVIPTLFRMAFRDESLYRSATTLKVVNEYGILDSVVNIDKGSVVSTKNLVYDAESGDVLISRTNNAFNKPVYQFNYPAWWVHSGMEPAYKNIDVVYSNVMFRNGKIAESLHVDTTLFESGDEIYLDYDKAEGPKESSACIATGQYGPILPVTTEYRIWALDISKDLRNPNKEFIFIDRFGNPVNAVKARIRIIRSGKRNLTGASVGSIVSMVSPIRTVSGQQRVVIDNNTNVINAGAAEIKERWRANDIFYAKDTTIYTTTLAPVHKDTMEARNSHTVNEYHYYKGSNRLQFRHEVFPDHFLGRHQSFGPQNNHTWRRDRSWLLFNVTKVPSDATILSAKLALYSHRYYGSSPEILHYFFKEGYHYSRDPHYRAPGYQNKFRLSRILSSWPANNNNTAWMTMYSAPGGTGSSYEILHDAPQNGYYDYAYNYQTSEDNRINITTMFKGMVKDYYDVTKTFAPAIKLNMINDNLNRADETRVCFWTRDGGGGHLQTAPYIEVKYYKCSEAYGLPGNPSSPPEGQETVPCVSAVTGKFCFSVFSKKQMNPYIEGVLGNWRAWKSYVYYGQRREINPATPTDIRKDGIIDQFETYWQLTSDDHDKLTRTNSTKWVWNAEITQYNRKGAELENHDPLERYNAGIYGYQESLPVAVINNSRLRLSAFDGFEDYYYQDDPCEPYCKPSHRHFVTGVSTNMLVETESHTGKYSVVLATGSTYAMNINVSANDEVYEPDIRIKLDKTAVNEVIKVTPDGTGLYGDYYENTGFTPPTEASGSPYQPRIDIRDRDFGAFHTCSGSGLPSGMRCHDISVRWTGFIQVVTSGDYVFSGGDVNDYTKMLINLTPSGSTYTTAFDAAHINGNLTETKSPVYLYAGTAYPVTIEFRQLGGVGKTNLYWKVPGSNNFVIVPTVNLYSSKASADDNVQTATGYCIKPDTIQAIKHQLIDSFNLVPGKDMVVSVWIKKGGQPCKTNSYEGINIYVKNNSNNNTIATLAPKERIIEGWQQFEAIFTVPTGTDKIKLEFHAPEVLLYFDDLRFHPFNANMKSFVYDPVTLRLAAELDENNYASFYEYDDSGGLIRVKKETKAGIKTITETRSAVQKKITDIQ